MTNIDSLPVSFANLVKAIDQVGPGETIPNVEHLQAPEVDTIGELLRGAPTPALQRERILGAIMGLLTDSGVPSGLAAVAVEELLSADPARQSVVRQRIRGGLETLKEEAQKRRTE